MEIRSHLLKGVAQQTTPNMGGHITPKLIVLHYTAGWTMDGAVSWLTNKKSKASCHVVVDNDGSMTQLVPFDKKAWHAGPSAYEGLKNLNSHSIGIEIANPGWLTEVSLGVYKTSAGHNVPQERLQGRETVKGTHYNLGNGELEKDWVLYPEDQLVAVEELVDALLEKYPSIRYIVGHDEIDTRGWKTDPGPAFPMDHFKKKVHGREDERTDGEQFQVDVSALNVRGGPGTKYDTLDSVSPLRNGVVVKRLERKGDWMYVEIDGFNKGWVHARYLKRVGF